MFSSALFLLACASHVGNGVFMPHNQFLFSKRSGMRRRPGKAPDDQLLQGLQDQVCELQKDRWAPAGEPGEWLRVVNKWLTVINAGK